MYITNVTKEVFGHYIAFAHKDSNWKVNLFYISEGKGNCDYQLLSIMGGGWSICYYGSYYATGWVSESSYALTTRLEMYGNDMCHQNVVVKVKV